MICVASRKEQFSPVQAIPAATGIIGSPTMETGGSVTPDFCTFFTASACDALGDHVGLSTRQLLTWIAKNGRTQYFGRRPSRQAFLAENEEVAGKVFTEPSALFQRVPLRIGELESCFSF